MQAQASTQTCRIVALLGAMVFAALGGCGGRTATVTGKVSYQGRPVTYGSVIFVGADKSARSTAIEADGSYMVASVPRGIAAIAVISPDPSKGRAAKKQDVANETAAKQWFALPSKFEDPRTSGLACTIDAGHVSHDIDLK
jgi:hypothetical protein